MNIVYIWVLSATMHQLTKNMTEKPTNYLDRILKFMGKDFNKYYNIQEIQNHLKSINLFDQKELVHFSDDNLMELKNAFYFLNQENLVAWNDNRNIIITYKGYIKIKTNGFEKEINKWLQRIAWTIPIIISTTALLVSIFK